MTNINVKNALETAQAELKAEKIEKDTKLLKAKLIEIDKLETALKNAKAEMEVLKEELSE